MIHLRTNKVAPPTFPFESKIENAPSEKAPRREQLAAWITSPDNRYFATSYVNRLWGYLTGAGVIEPLDDIRAGNPPTNPELLDYLKTEFINHSFDVRHILRLICQSRTYQLSVSMNKWNVKTTRSTTARSSPGGCRRKCSMIPCSKSPVRPRDCPAALAW